MDREKAALASRDHWFRHWMPYEFVRLGSGGEHAYLPFNRELKPLGVSAPGCVRLGDHRSRAVVFRLQAADGASVPAALPRRAGGQ